MIAQVFTVQGPGGEGGGPGEAGRKGIDDTRAADGCEGLYVLGDRSTGEGMAIVFWRDEAAMNAWRSRQDDDLRAARQEAPADFNVSEPRIYEVMNA